MNHPPTDEALIAFTTRYYRHAGAKDAAIRAEFGVSNARFWQMTLAVLRDPERVAGLPVELQTQAARLNRRFAA